VGRRILTQTDSTMAEAARRAEAGIPGPEWTLALAQTAGRGRRGRPWAMPEGNFAATLLMRPTGTAAEAALGLSWRRWPCARRSSPSVLTQRFSLKWPNDVLLNGRQARRDPAGKPRATGRGGVAWLSIGIGVNLAAANTDPEQVEPGAVPRISLRRDGRLSGARRRSSTTGGRLRPVSNAVHDLRVRAHPAAWLSQAARLGESHHRADAGEEITGTVRDVDGAGNLVLETPGGT
jgi:BirA family biotin operon repressor/biotin-[acetyl-CoA-carboxylase] ligase